MDPVDPVALPVLPALPPDAVLPDERRAFASTNCSLLELLDLPSEPVLAADVEPPAVDPAPLLLVLPALPALDVLPLVDVPDVLLVPDICIRHPEAVTFRPALPLCPVLPELCACPIVVLAQIAITAAAVQMKVRFIVRSLPSLIDAMRDAKRVADIAMSRCAVQGRDHMDMAPRE